MPSLPEKGLHLDWCSYQAALYACRHWHYSRSMAVSKTVKVGVWEDRRFIGAIVFARGANQHLGKAFGLSLCECAELVRVALDTHRAPVSQMLRIALKMLKQQSPGLRLVISYADCDQNHLGVVYQAGNWIYLGQVETNGGTPKYRIHGRVMHGRSVHSRYGRGSQNLDWLRSHVDPRTEQVWTRGKHKYALSLDAGMRDFLASMAKPYPKRPKDSSEPLTDQVREGGAAPTRTLQIAHI